MSAKMVDAVPLLLQIQLGAFLITRASFQQRRKGTVGARHRQMFCIKAKYLMPCPYTQGKT
ncbi:hypothetical protein [Microseira wollei]|uniref:hypothetical protein n=1 Tax=Microseira wollei TaxID=467598 RepID=UPI001CFF4A18|nr:hypothetical protein [Microseira wollei]